MYGVYIRVRFCINPYASHIFSRVLNLSPPLLDKLAWRAPRCFTSHPQISGYRATLSSGMPSCCPGIPGERSSCRDWHGALSHSPLRPRLHGPQETLRKAQPSRGASGYAVLETSIVLMGRNIRRRRRGDRRRRRWGERGILGERWVSTRGVFRGRDGPPGLYIYQVLSFPAGWQVRDKRDIQRRREGEGLFSD